MPKWAPRKHRKWSLFRMAAKLGFGASQTQEQEQMLVGLELAKMSNGKNLTILVVLGTFNLMVRVEYLFFIGSQLVALSPSGKLGVWHAMTQHWQTQDVMPIASFDTAGSILLLGCNNGCIYYIGENTF